MLVLSRCGAVENRKHDARRGRNFAHLTEGAARISPRRPVSLLFRERQRCPTNIVQGVLGYLYNLILKPHSYSL